MKLTEIWDRIKYLNLTNIEEYQRYVNPEHARLNNILKYSTDWLHFYQRKRTLIKFSQQSEKNFENQWLLKEIKLLSNLNKDLKLRIKQVNKNYNT